MGKKWWQSKGVMGGLIVLATGLLGSFGVDIDQAAVMDIGLQVGTVAGGALAIYGRIKADSPISITKKNG